MVLSRNLVLPVLAGVALCGVSGVLLYLLLRKDEEETLQSTQERTVEFLIPELVVPSLIGKCGSNIKELQQASGAHISFRHEDQPQGLPKMRMVIIRGHLHAVRIAETLVKEAVTSHVATQEETIDVPSWCSGKIIGRGGEEIRNICHTSGAKVQFRDRTATSAATQQVFIRGKPNQINLAKEMINRVVETEQKNRETNASKREPRRQPTAGKCGGQAAGLTQTPPFSPEGAGALLEVFVSAVSSPSRFWLQIAGPQSRKLDDLVEEMSAYYSNSENRILHELSDVQVGQLVAAVYRHDGKWYRAKVVEIKPNEFDVRKQVCDLYFVDYGDNEYVACHELLGLRTDMLQLRNQAVTCFLAGASPHPQHGEHWHTQAIERFEELTQVARWKRLWSRTCTFQEPAVAAEGAETPRGAREGSPVPGVKLYDIKDGVDIDIAEVLIQEGWAVPTDESTTPTVSIPSNPASESTLLPAQPPLLPSFGDLQCSRVLGMVVDDGEDRGAAGEGGERREERSLSLPHSGPEQRGPPTPERNAQGDGDFGDYRLKSSSLSAGMDQGKHFTLGDGSIQDLSYAKDPNQVNGSSLVTNGSAKQNGAFIHAERERVDMDATTIHTRDVLKGNPESFSKPLPLINTLDPKDEFKAKINRVDSHHGNLESLGKLNPPPIALTKSS